PRVVGVHRLGRARARRGVARRPPADGVPPLARRPPARARTAALGRPVLLPAGGRAGEPCLVAVRAAVLAARVDARARAGLEPVHAALLRRCGRARAALAASGRTLVSRVSRRWAGVRDRPLPHRAESRSSARPDLPAPPARALGVRAGLAERQTRLVAALVARARLDPAFGPGPPSPRRDPLLPRLRRLPGARAARGDRGGGRDRGRGPRGRADQADGD